MRGYPRFNFDAFYAAEEDLQSRGYETINPARIDEEHGIDPDTMTFEEHIEPIFNELVTRDVEAIIQCDGIVLLPEWQSSVGAKAELAVCSWLNKQAYVYPDMCLLEDYDILSEAFMLTEEDRQKDYGPAVDDMTRIAKMWSALKGVEFEPKEVPMFFICAKLSREMNSFKRDNSVDTAGYARVLWKCALDNKRSKS